MKTKRKMATLAGTAALAALAINLQAPTVDAADHIDGSVGADAAADIADFYAWENDAGNIVAIMTYGALLNAGDDPVYDEGVLYTFHIDNTASAAEAVDWADNGNDNESDIQIHVRFGQNALGDWGVQVLNLPGADAELVGGVGTDLGRAGGRAHAAMFDDPFFFDLIGFQDTVANIDTDDGAMDVDLAFNSLVGDPAEPVDGFAGLNTMAIIVEFNATEALNENADNFLQMWVTTGRVAR